MPKLVWGLPVRIFHWGLLGMIGVSYYTGKFGDFDSIDNHMLAGYGIIGLVLFRILFGLLGQGHVRFSNFIRGPGAVAAYVKAPAETAGHNPLGALGVIALLLSLAVQTGTGLFTTDEIFVEGPLYHLVSTEVASVCTQVHEINQWVLLALIVIHVCAVIFHEVKLGHRILWPMITGKKTGDAVANEPEQSHQIILAVVCSIVAAAATWYVVNEI
jgi:cytochrome b